MLPSNASPTISALILITGLPEFPPTISFVLTKLRDVERSKSSGRSSQYCGRLNGNFLSNE